MTSLPRCPSSTDDIRPMRPAPLPPSSPAAVAAPRGELGTAALVPQRGRMRGWLEPSIVACALLAVFCTRIEGVSFWPDESQWIATSYFFEGFRDRLGAPFLWDESYWTLTQPPLARYVIGLGRLAGGYSMRDLNEPWEFKSDAAANVARGAMPGPGLLWWSRLPMALLTVLSIVILFCLVTRAAGRVAGYTLVLLLAGNPYVYSTLCRAMSEAPLLACVAMAMLASDWALGCWQRAATASHPSVKALRPAAACFFLMGSMCGLGAAAKLNGFATVAAGLVLCVLAAVTHAGNVAKSARATFIIAVSGLLLFGTALIFVAANPYLYPDPLGHTLAMFTSRLTEVQKHIGLYPRFAIHGLGMRFDVVSQRVLQDFAAISVRGAIFINLLLCAIGASVLVRAAWSWLRGNENGGTSMVLMAVAFTTAAPALLTPLDWDRYYLLPVIFSSVGIAVGIAACVTCLFALVWPRTAPDVDVLRAGALS